MIPILFPRDATEFATRGLGPLSDATSCIVTEERNGVYELTMTYPKSGIHFSDIAIGNIICAIPSPYRLPQPFRVYKISRVMRGSITVYAQHISYDLSGVTVKPYSATGITAIFSGLKENSINHNAFRFSGESTFVGSVQYSVPNTARQILGGMTGSVLDVFGGEYEFDNFDVRLHVNRGTNSGVSIRYGKNLLDVTQDHDATSTIAGVCPYWVSSEDENNVVFGNVVYFDSELTNSKVVPLDMSEYFDTQPTTEQLEQRAKSYITSNYSSEPVFNCTVSFALIEQSEEYKEYALLEKCDLCDTVNVFYPSLGVNSTAKIAKIVTDVLREKYNSVTLGSVRANIAQTIAEQQKSIDDTPTTQTLNQIVRGTLGKITGAQGGSVRTLDTDGDGSPDTLYIADNPDPVRAKRVWRFNYLGWAASKNGYNGPFVLGATLEDGLLAEFVTAAHLTTGSIESADGESISIDLNGGIFQLSSPSVYFNIQGDLGDTVWDDTGMSTPRINSPSVFPAYTGPEEIHVSTNANPPTVFTSLSDAFSALNGHYLPNDVSIYIDAGVNITESEITLKNIFGSSITVLSSSPNKADIYGRVTCINVNSKITFDSINIKFGNADSVFNFVNCRYVYVNSCIINSGGYETYGAYGIYSEISIVSVNETEFYNCYYGMYANNCSSILCNACAGDFIYTMFVAMNNSRICAQVSRPNSNTYSDLDASSYVMPDPGINKGPHAIPDKPIITIISEYKPASVNTAFKNANVINAEWTIVETGYMTQGIRVDYNRIGIMRFGTSIVSDISAIAAVIRIHRSSSNDGSSSKIDVCLGTANVVGDWESIIDLTEYGVIGQVDRNEFLETSIPLGAAQSLIDGKANALYIYSNDTDVITWKKFSQNAGAFDGVSDSRYAPMLAITHQRKAE